MSKYPYHTIGSKYEETADLDIKDVAKLVRKDLKEAFPTYKFSVRIERYAGGQSISLEAYNTGIDRHSESGNALERALRQVTDEYNYNDDDLLSDYHHTRFYCFPRIKS